MLEVVFAAGVSDVFAENGNAFVAGHFVGKGGGDHFDHGLWCAAQPRLRFERG